MSFRLSKHISPVIVALLLMTTISNLPAQVTTADVTGRVADQSGAAVPNATVTARNAATGFARSTTSDTQGFYTIYQLPPGSYEITVEAPTFRKTVVKELELNVGVRQTQNFELRPGEVAETVEVAADALAVETTRSDLAGVVTSNEVENLPLLNRTFAALTVVMPEARPIGNFDPTKTRIGNVAFNGGDGRQVDVNIDGADNKDNVVGGLIQNFAYESIQEFNVLQHRWTAESGRAVGGVVNVITKSGTNDWHGSLFSQFRDERLRAMDFIEEQNQLTNPAFEKPDFSRQEFGGSFGGPIVRDNMFFFGALERFRERQVNIPTAAALLQLQAIPGAQPGNIDTPYDDWLASVKVDHRWSDAQTMFYRYSFQDNASPNDQVPVPATADLTQGNSNDNRFHSFVANHTWQVSSTKVNEIKFAYQDFSNEILSVTTIPNQTFVTVQTGTNANVPQATFERKYQFRDDFSWVAGRHNLKLGTNYIWTNMDGFFFFGVQGYQINWFDDPVTIANNTNGLYPQAFATPGAIRTLTFSDGRGDHKQRLHQLAFYLQDDFKLSPRLTLNLGLRWDANIGNLPDQTNNRTIQLLTGLNHPLAQAITGDPEDLSRTTPSWKEFQPRVGFAWDPTGSGKTVIRGGYGIFYDQVFQNLTLFSLTQTNPELFQPILNFTNTAVGAGQLPAFRFGVDPLPAPAPGFDISQLSFGGFGRINDPDMREPYVQKFSFGFETTIARNTTISSDYVHSLGLHESRVQVINPLIRNICSAAFPGSNPADPRCVRGANSREFDSAFVAAGIPLQTSAGAPVGPCVPPIAAGSPCLSALARVEQINMIGTTNRSLFDSWTTTLRRRAGKTTFSASYVLANSRAWGGQPVASYSGNGIAIVPQNQFREEEWGPTRIDERHRVVLSGVFDLPWGFQFASLMQYASSRPYSMNSGADLDGDGLVTVDRVCEGADLTQMLFNAIAGASQAALNTPGCQQVPVNNVRTGFVRHPISGELEERSGRFLNIDLRAAKSFKLGERVNIKGFADFFNLFNNDNLNIGGRLGLSPATSRTFRQVTALYGPGFGPPVGRPLTVQLGFRMDF